jgi:hypothetical protein
LVSQPENIGAAYPNQTFTGWMPPASPVNKSPTLSRIEAKRVKVTGRIEMYKGKPAIRIKLLLSSRLSKIAADGKSLSLT